MSDNQGLSRRNAPPLSDLHRNVECLYYYVATQCAMLEYSVLVNGRLMRPLKKCYFL